MRYCRSRIAWCPIFQFAPSIQRRPQCKSLSSIPSGSWCVVLVHGLIPIRLCLCLRGNLIDAKLYTKMIVFNSSTWYFYKNFISIFQGLINDESDPRVRYYIFWNVHPSWGKIMVCNMPSKRASPPQAVKLLL